MRSRRYYLSTRKDRASEAESLASALHVSGWERTYTWADLGKGVSSAQFAEAAIAELKGVRDADVLIVLLPGGFGTHVEIGAALALSKPVILHAPDTETSDAPYPCIFHYHPAVKLLISSPVKVDEIIAAADAAMQ